MDQSPQGLWLGPKDPTDGAVGCSLPQELEKARKADYFSCIFIFPKYSVLWANLSRMEMIIERLQEHKFVIGNIGGKTDF